MNIPKGKANEHSLKVSAFHLLLLALSSSMNRLPVLTFLFSLTFSLANAQEEILAEGKITDSRTSKGIKANVRYSSIPTGSIFGRFNDSTFSFPIFGTAKYQITAEAKGYNPRTVIVDPKCHVNQATYNRLGPSGCLYLRYFYSDLVPRLEDPALGSFWTRTVLREATRNNCILDAIIGIAALARAAENHRNLVSLSKADLSSCPAFSATRPDRQ